jgi:hypothetical protein
VLLPCFAAGSELSFDQARAALLSRSDKLKAADALAAGAIAGVVVVPENFHRDALRGTPTALTAFGSGAYPVSAG